MNTAYRNVARIDVHKKMLAVVVRQQEEGQVRVREAEVWDHASRDRGPRGRKSDLRDAIDWLIGGTPGI